MCSLNPLPGYKQLEKLSQLLAGIAEDEGKLSLSSSQRDAVIEAWNSLEDHDRSPQNFRSVYKSHWGNTLYGRTKGDPTEAGVTQIVKFRNRYTPAQTIDVKRNRLVYSVVKHIWLRSDRASSPGKKSITTSYERMVQRVMVEDPVLSKLGMPLPKINRKCVRDFLRRQEALASTNATNQGVTIIRRVTSISSTPLPDAPPLPSTRPQTTWSESQFQETVCLAGTKVTKKRQDVVQPQLVGDSQVCVPATPQAQLSAPKAWARSTAYKRKQKERSVCTLVPKKKKTETVPLCILCEQAMQGHQKYRKKSWCDRTRRSTSKGLNDKDFDNFEHFKAAVNKTLDT